MASQFKYKASTWFVGGLLCGLLSHQVVVRALGWSVLSPQQSIQQQTLLAELREENEQLTEDLFRPGTLSEPPLDPISLPYDEQADAPVEVAAAREAAREAHKFLMITFGANWCLDCRTLYRHLKSSEVAAYTDGLFDFASVDVGKFNRNRDLAEELGVDLSRGIPVAIFYDPTGRVIGTTNEGQLEHARFYSSKQILRFVRDIAERARIAAPDSVNFQGL